MPDLKCTCGAAIPVELWDAGSDKRCAVCNTLVPVPSLDELKRLSGDLHPELNDWEKLLHAVEHREAPFHGICHECGIANATMEVPVEVSVMEERQVDDDAPVSITPLGVNLQVAGSTEYWKSAAFPLLFCDQCYDQFASSFRARSVLQWILVTCASVVALAAFLFMATPYGTWGVLIPLLIAVGLARRWKKDVRFSRWIANIPLVERILAKEEEHRLRKGTPRRIETCALTDDRSRSV